VKICAGEFSEETDNLCPPERAPHHTAQTFGRVLRKKSKRPTDKKSAPESYCGDGHCPSKEHGNWRECL